MMGVFFFTQSGAAIAILSQNFLWGSAKILLLFFFLDAGFGLDGDLIQ